MCDRETLQQQSLTGRGPRENLAALRRGQEGQHEPGRVFERFLDPDEEGDRFLAVDDAVIVTQRQIHHRANLDLARYSHRAILDLVHAQYAGLRGVEDRRRHQRTVDAAVGDGERAALHLLDLQTTLARALAV